MSENCVTGSDVKKSGTEEVGLPMKWVSENRGDLKKVVLTNFDISILSN